MKETIRQLSSFFAYGGKLQEDQTPSWDKPPKGQLADVQILDDKERLWTDIGIQTKNCASYFGLIIK